MSDRARAEAERREAWLERHAANAPAVTWERWATANAALGITVKRQAQ